MLCSFVVLFAAVYGVNPVSVSTSCVPLTVAFPNVPLSAFHAVTSPLTSFDSTLNMPNIVSRFSISLLIPSTITAPSLMLWNVSSVAPVIALKAAAFNTSNLSCVADTIAAIRLGTFSQSASTTCGVIPKYDAILLTSSYVGVPPSSICFCTASNSVCALYHASALSLMVLYASEMLFALASETFPIFSICSVMFDKL